MFRLSSFNRDVFFSVVCDVINNFITSDYQTIYPRNRITLGLSHILIITMYRKSGEFMP